MPTETPGGRKLAKAMPDHVFRDKYGYERSPVVHVERVAHKIGEDHGTPAPCPDRALLPRVVHSYDLAHQRLVDERPFLN